MAGCDNKAHYGLPYGSLLLAKCGKKGQKNIHRSAGSSVATRNRKKLLGKTSWFRSRGKQTRTSAIAKKGKRTTSRPPGRQQNDKKATAEGHRATSRPPGGQQNEKNATVEGQKTKQNN